MEEYEMIEKIRNGTIPFEMALEKYHNFIWKFINEYNIVYGIVSSHSNL